MDDYRAEQKKLCTSYSNKKSHYGCPCCRLIASLNEFKKWARKLARRRLKQTDKENLKKEIY